MKYIIVDFVNAISGETVRSLSFSTIKYAEEYCSKYNQNSHESMVAIVRTTAAAEEKTPFQRVAEMNTAFGNAKGNSENIDWTKIRSQCRNIFDEYLELLTALGISETNLTELKALHKFTVHRDDFCDADFEAVRDALCDIQVFAQGAQHMMGYSGDNDMHDVVDGVMSRFIKDEADKVATIQLHAAKGVVEVYFEGDFPKMVMKSAVDQPDAPRGKFMKSFSYAVTIFRPAP